MTEMKRLEKHTVHLTQPNSELVKEKNGPDTGQIKGQNQQNKEHAGEATQNHLHINNVNEDSKNKHSNTETTNLHINQSKSRNKQPEHFK